MFDINNLKYNSDGLIPAIITDAADGAVLMLGYMNAESLGITLDRKKVCFFSRSRQKLWLKGETSGNFLNVVSIKTDCDADTLLITAKPEGPHATRARAPASLRKSMRMMTQSRLSALMIS